MLASQSVASLPSGTSSQAQGSGISWSPRDLGGVGLVFITWGHVGSSRRAVGLQRSAPPPWWAPHAAPGAGAAVLGKPRTAPRQGLRVKRRHGGYLRASPFLYGAHREMAGEAAAGSRAPSGCGHGTAMAVPCLCKLPLLSAGPARNRPGSPEIHHGCDRWQVSPRMGHPWM